MEIKLKGELLYLDGLRAVAALYVVFHHAVLQFYKLEYVELTGIKRITVTSLFHGGRAVDLFIVLSGFCLMLPIIKNAYKLNGSVLRFFTRRAIRILPPYYFAMIVCLILISLFIGQKTGTHWDSSIPVTSNDILTHVFLIHDIFDSHIGKINHAFWSISVECRIYLFFPILILIWRLLGTYYLFLFSTLLSVILYVVLSRLQILYPDINTSFPGVNPYILLFTMGMIAADYSFSDRIKSNWEQKIPWGVLSIVFILTYYFMLKAFSYFDIRPGTILNELINIEFGLCCCCILITSSKEGLIQQLLSRTPLVFLGRFAYSIYLIHGPLLQLLTIHLIYPMHLSKYNSFIALVCFSVMLILPASYLFYLAFELPFIKLGKLLYNRKAKVGLL